MSKPITVILRKDNWMRTANNLLDNLKKIDHNKDHKVVIREYTPEMDRTNAQNAYLHKVFAIINEAWADASGEHFGEPAWKIFFKKDYFGVVTVETPDGPYEDLQKTSDLGKQKFNEFVEYIRTWAYNNMSELYILTPDEWRQSKHYKL